MKEEMDQLWKQAQARRQHTGLLQLLLEVGFWKFLSRNLGKVKR